MLSASESPAVRRRLRRRGSTGVSVPNPGRSRTRPYYSAISPDNPIGEIYRYTVESPDHDLTNEKTIEDWILEKQIKTVPGVEDVSGFGGLTKQFQVEVDPHKLNYYQVPLSTLIAALQNSNTNSGGNYMSVGEQAFDVRGLGFFRPAVVATVPRRCRMGIGQTLKPPL